MTQQIPIQAILKNQESQLGKIIAQALAFEDLSKTLYRVLDPDYIPHCQVGCYQLGVLTISVDSPAWATKLRFQVPTLLSKLRAIPTWAGLSSIQVKVKKIWPMAPTRSKPEPITEVSKPSLLNSKQLLNLANSLKNQPNTDKLINILLRIANLATP